MRKRTPLYNSHIALGARMVEFGGWDMPVQYSGVLDEHTAVRTGAGLFDISHMGRFLVIGPDALPFLQYVTTCDVAKVDMGASSYGFFCTPEGGIVDDIFIYHMPNAYMVVVNAANHQKDRDLMMYHSSKFNTKIADYTDQWAMVALQGPASEALLDQCPDVEVDNLPGLPFHAITSCRLFKVDGCQIARTGYTGEDGFEIFFDARKAARVWDGLLAAGAEVPLKPCGLGARDSLRFEPCLPLYGHELTEETTPYEARLKWAVKLDKENDFIGREALLKLSQQKPERSLVGFEMVERGVARSGYLIHNLENDPVGVVTSGMPSPTLGKPLGLGYVPAPLSSQGTEFNIIIRNKPVRARVVKTPFYKPRYKK
jgi:aminomethyltransferase